MLVQYFIACYLFFAMVFSAPLLNTYSEKTSQSTASTSPANNKRLPNITLPKSFQRKINYETLGGGFEGDMIFPKGFNPSKPSKEKGVAINGPHRWPDNVIPYDLSEITSTDDQDFITNAIQTLMYAVGTPVDGETSRQACVLFRPRSADEQNFVKFTYGDGCSGTVGYWPDTEMKLTLANPGCFVSGIIQHELTHILGFYHEQSRPDRDSYITVNYENIQSGMEYNFDKYEWGQDVLDQNTAYDYGSVMHYDAYAFSSNGEPTIVPKTDGVTIGQRDGLSATDIAEIRAYYGC